MKTSKKYDRQIRTLGHTLHTTLSKTSVSLNGHSSIHTELFKNFLLLGVRQLTVCKGLIEKVKEILPDYEKVNEKCEILELKSELKSDFDVSVGGTMFKVCEKCAEYWQVNDTKKYLGIISGNSVNNGENSEDVNKIMSESFNSEKNYEISEKILENSENNEIICEELHICPSNDPQPPEHQCLLGSILTQEIIKLIGNEKYQKQYKIEL